MGCGVSCIKFLVFFFNLLFALTGLIILTIGAIIQSSYHHYSNFIGDSFWSAPILFIVLGSIVFVISFFGCCGAVKESSCMLSTFAVFLVAIIISEIGIGVAGYLKHKHLGGILESGFNQTFNDYTTSVDAQHAWYLVQSELVCCGINGPDDWDSKFHNKSLPKPCCPTLPVDVHTCSKLYAVTDGCLPKLFSFLDSKAMALAVSGIGIAFIQILGVCYAFCLCRAFRANYETV